MFNKLGTVVDDLVAPVDRPVKTFVLQRVCEQAVAFLQMSRQDVFMNENLFGFDEPAPARETKTKKSKRSKSKLVSPAEIQQVFDEWLRWCKTSGRGVRPKLSEERSIIIGAAIYDYGLTDCLLAVQGCSLSSWHMGENPTGTKYDDVELILRDAKHVERFACLAAAEEAKND